MKSIFAKIAKSDEAVTAIEYALLAAVLAIGAIASFESMGAKIKGLFQGVHSSYENVEDLG